MAEAQPGDRLARARGETDATVGSRSGLIAVRGRDEAAGDRQQRDAAGAENIDRVIRIDRPPVKTDRLELRRRQRRRRRVELGRDEAEGVAGRGSLGDRQVLIHLPLGRLGLIVMSYFGNVAERSKRALYFSISSAATVTFLA